MRSALLLLSLGLAFGTAAFAPISLAHAAEDEDEPIPAPLPPATDTLGGHLVLGIAGGLVLPFGGLQEGLGQRRAVGNGYGIAIDAGYGLSRTVVAGIWGSLEDYGAGSACDACRSTAQAVGAFVRYHLVQGVRFDPWISAGAGYRTLGIDAGDFDLAYSGIELLDLRVGGDWYAFRTLGIGPFLSFESTLLTSRPEEATQLDRHSADGSALAYAFTAGVRLVLDLPGK